VCLSGKGWDKGLDYETTYRIILRKINSVKNNTTKCYFVIALIQLRNGSRISEAIRAFKQWIRTSKVEIYVNVSKKRHEELRLMIIPQEVIQYRLTCVDLLEVNDKLLRNRVLATLYYYLKINTHSLRYAFITYLLKNNINVAVVSKLVKHSKLDTLLHYVQSKEAERVLREIA
jgi:site-specific recombinase XerD